MEFLNKIFRGDRVMWMIFMFLCLISIVEVYSASSTLTFRTDYWRPIMKHTLFLLAGLGVVLLVHSCLPKWFSLAVIGLPITWFLLIATKLIGSSTNEAQRYLSVFGLSFQPSELAKLCLIGATAFFLSKYNQSKNNIYYNIILWMSAITCGIILLDNFSTAILLFLVIVIMLFIGQVPFKQLLKLGLICIVAGAAFVGFLLFTPKNIMEPVFPRGITWQGRIDRFLQEDEPKDGEYVINDKNYQVSHANIAVARGKLFGNLPGNSRERDYLPQAYSDFIFAIIIEELGLVGGIFVLALYVFLFIRAGIIAGRCEKLFPKYLVIGCALLIVIQALANMAVAVNLIPVTGQPLPLVSRGGTSTLVTCAFVGIILSVSRFENPKGVKREEEIVAELEEAERIAEENKTETGEDWVVAEVY
ncbi:rod shape-determining protein RodA [Bacteroidia bacterium]|nr:rod shape-determining protein RodA [Bacteroidia bacterium]